MESFHSVLKKEEIYLHTCQYGKVRAELESKGMPIGPMDLLIAGHARSEGLILVTNNTREFCRVEGLVVEDWTKEQAGEMRRCGGHAC